MLASVTGSLTSFVGDHGLYAIFALMVLAAVFPAASELVMLYGGAVAAGAFASSHIVLFGNRLTTPFWAYVAVAITGLVANLIGAVTGWVIGAVGGRPLVERRGRWVHADERRFERAEERFRRRGAPAVAVGFALPVIRSFVAIPAGILRIPLSRFVPLALLGCAVFCFGLAGAGWAVGASYERVHRDLRYVDVAVFLVALVVLAALILRARSSRLARRAGPSG